MSNLFSRSINLKTRAISFFVSIVILLGLFCTDSHAFMGNWFKGKQKNTSSVVVHPLEQPAPQHLSLQDVYKRALFHSQDIAMTEQEIAKAQSRFYRAFDYFLPTVHFEMTHFQQDVTGESSGSGGFDFSRKTKPEKKFTFTQPLFSGFKEIAALTGSGADKKEQLFKLKRAKETLFVDVVDAYYLLLSSQRIVEIHQEIHHLMSERIGELNERVEIGRSRSSELFSTTTDAKILQSDLVMAQRDLQNAKNLLDYYMGYEHGLGNYLLIEDNGEDNRNEIDLTQVNQRSDVGRYEQAYILYQKKVIAANSNLFPTIDLNGNIYTQRDGFQEGNDWDVIFKIDVPVFTVGKTLGDIKEAQANREQAKHQLEWQKQQALLEAQNTWEDYLAAKQTELLLSEANDAAKQNFESLQEEFRSSLVNNIEVLDGIKKYQEILGRYETAKADRKRYYWKLKYSLGEEIIDGKTK